MSYKLSQYSIQMSHYLNFNTNVSSLKISMLINDGKKKSKKIRTGVKK